MRASRITLLAAVVTGGALSRRSFRNRVASWDTNPDPSEGEPLTLPDHETLHHEAADGARLHARRCGDRAGATVVLVHGFIEHTAFWGPVARRLAADGLDVVLVDQRGHGRSQRGTAPYSTATLGQDLAGWLEHLDVSDAVLAGHSMGGVAVMACARDHAPVLSERIAHLALVTTLARPSDRPGPDLGSVRSLRLATAALGRRDIGLACLGAVFGPRPARVALEATRAGFLGTNPQTRIDAMDMLSDFDLRPGLENITVPTVVVAGTHDGLTPVELNQEIADLIPRARFEVLPGVGHMLPFEAPDRLTDLLVQATKPAA